MIKYNIITSYPTRANGIIVLVNSQTGFCRRFLFPQFYKAKIFKLGALFSIELRILAHSRSFSANQKARNAIFGAENLLINNYSPKWRWLAVDIYRAAKRRGKYPTLATDTEVNSCFSIY